MHSHLQRLGFFFTFTTGSSLPFAILFICFVHWQHKQEKVVVKVKGTLEQRDNQGAFEQHTLRDLKPLSGRQDRIVALLVQVCRIINRHQLDRLFKHLSQSWLILWAIQTLLD